jgi:hypothetical protein
LDGQKEWKVKAKVWPNNSEHFWEMTMPPHWHLLAVQSSCGYVLHVFNLDDACTILNHQVNLAWTVLPVRLGVERYQQAWGRETDRSDSQGTYGMDNAESRRIVPG